MAAKDRIDREYGLRMGWLIFGAMIPLIVLIALINYYGATT